MMRYFDCFQDTMQNEPHLSSDRLEKIDAPLLVIGLGGAGSEAMHVIKSTFAKCFDSPSDAAGNATIVLHNTAYLVIDCDNGSQGILPSDEYLSINVPGLGGPTKPWENEWLDRHMDFSGYSNRQKARLLLCRNYSQVFSFINHKLQQIAADAPNGSTLNIVIISSLAGSTGSGIFLDIAQIVRSIMSRNAMLNRHRYRLSAHLIMPDVSCSGVPATHPLQEVYKSNAYAALKELDFWMGYECTHKTTYTMQYSAYAASRITWVRPFDVCTLMSGTTYDGIPFIHPRGMVYNTIAEYLLHYLTRENNLPDADSYPGFLRTLINAVCPKTPVNHSYRAIGAYTIKIPKKKMLCYEGRLLFGTFMPERDEHGEILPVAKLVNRGVCRADVINVCGDLQEHYRRFKDVVRLPAFCNIDPSDRNGVESLRQMRPEPHYHVDIGNDPWRSSVLIPEAQQSAEQYLDITWRNFVAFAEDVISDPDFGPYALLDYLTEGEKTLRHSLSELLNYWDSSEKHFCGALTHLEQNCRSTWGAFLNPPLFGHRAAMENYMRNLIGYYDGIRRAEFAGAYAKALEKFSKRVDEYRDQALRQLCKALDQMDQYFSDNNTERDEASSELFSLDAVRASLDNSFTTNNDNQCVTREFLSRLCKASFVTERNPDVHSSGASFTFGRNSLSNICGILREDFDQCFGGINNASIDQFLTWQVGDHESNRSAAMDRVATQITQRACPLFSKDPATIDAPYVKSTYLSMPDNAPGYRAHFINTLDNVLCGQHSLRDRIVCLNLCDGIPLYHCSQLQDLEMAYAIRLSMPSRSKGMHLVWDGNLDSDVITNWSKLPSPRPFYFFGASGSEADKRDFESAQTLVERALACGMLTIDDTQPTPTYTLRIHYCDGVPAPKSSNLIHHDIAQIDQMTDPITNEPLTDVQKQQALLDYLNSSTVTTVAKTVSPLCMQKYLGLEGQPCDPFMDGIIGNPITLEIAWENHKRLCRALVAAMLCADPFTRLGMEIQLEGAECLQKRMNPVD